MFRSAGGLLVGALDKRPGQKVHLEIRDSFKTDISTGEIARAMVTGAILNNYCFEDYKNPKDRKKPALGSLVFFGESHFFSHHIRKGLIEAEQQNMVRDLVNEPACYLTPDLFVKNIISTGRKHKLPVKVWKEVDLRRDNMNAILAVGQGSRHPPRLATISYLGRGGKDIDIALVGKGVTFDSGGISIKDSDNMSEMKGDMAGAAVVLAAVSGAARLRLKVNVTGVIPLAENMPGGGAQRPGDIIKTASGVTIEVDNTDAEGRLLLADAIYLAATLKPKAGIVDVATLTGSCTVALGSQAIALMGNNSNLIDRIKKASFASGERIWELPLWDDYKELIESKPADVRNTSSRPREAGTIVGGMFLKRFAGETPWAHLDIAGVYLTNNSVHYLASGSSGRCTRLLLTTIDECIK
jgi:leucyl aminopeptidase